MPETPSVMIPIGSQMPAFTLEDANGDTWSLPTEHNGVLVIFMCNHCPYVVQIAAVLPAIHEACKSSGIAMVGINSNDVENYPADSPDNMINAANEYGWTFPYLYDESQVVAKSFHAVCTPDVFLYAANDGLYYRGQLDDSRPNDGSTATGEDLLDAIDRLQRGEPSPEVQKPAIGCSIKWKV